MTQNDAKAVHWYAAAAVQGDAEAQYNLGMLLCWQLWEFQLTALMHAGLCYAHGQGVRKDDSKAAHWWSAAAAQGVSQAQFALGRFCLDLAI